AGRGASTFPAPVGSPAGLFMRTRIPLPPHRLERAMPETFVRGLSAEESPLPEPELSLGNVVRLKRPSVAEKGTKFIHGVIAEHVGHNAFGFPVVCLYVFDDTGRLHLVKGSMVPASVDTCATDLILLYVCKENRAFPGGHDLYPTCPTCD